MQDNDNIPTGSECFEDELVKFEDQDSESCTTIEPYYSLGKRHGARDARGKRRG